MEILFWRILKDPEQRNFRQVFVHTAEHSQLLDFWFFLSNKVSNLSTRIVSGKPQFKIVNFFKEQTGISHLFLII